MGLGSLTDLKDLRKELMLAKTTDKLKASVLTMVLAEALNIAKSDGNREVTTNDIEGALKRINKMAEQSLAAGVAGADKELECLKQYLPEMLSVEDTESIVNALLEVHGNNVGSIMKELKTTYGSKIDMKLVSSIIKK